ncbi:MAG TPA: DUF5615 family PIN-like protein [Bacillales bacterium]|nr:DUF5615 family PIN-like protein [Bacillales bacterium]
MRLFLDENITPKAGEYLSDLGHDVTSVYAKGIRGTDDGQLFEIAKKECRLFITQNGKDFIRFIPPQSPDVQHYGVLWLTFQLTRLNAIHFCKGFHDFQCAGQAELIDAIWKVREDAKGKFQFIKRYPK